MEVLSNESKYHLYCCIIRGFSKAAAFCTWLFSLFLSLVLCLPKVFTSAWSPDLVNTSFSHLLFNSSIQSWFSYWLQVSQESWIFQRLQDVHFEGTVIRSKLLSHHYYHQLVLGIQQIVSGLSSPLVYQLLTSAAIFGCLFHLCFAIRYGFCQLLLRLSAVPQRKHKAIPDLAILISTTVDSDRSTSISYSLFYGLVFLFITPFTTMGSLLVRLFFSVVPTFPYGLFPSANPYDLCVLDFLSREALLQTLIPRIRLIPFNAPALFTAIVRASSNSNWPDREAFLSARSIILQFTTAWDFLHWFIKWELLDVEYSTISNISRQQALATCKPIRSYPELLSFLRTLDEMPFLHQHFPKVFRQLAYRGALSYPPVRAHLKAIFDRSVNSFQFFAALDCALWDLTPSLDSKPRVRPAQVKHYLRNGSRPAHRTSLTASAYYPATIQSQRELSLSSNDHSSRLLYFPHLILFSLIGCYFRSSLMLFLSSSWTALKPTVLAYQFLLITWSSKLATTVRLTLNHGLSTNDSKSAMYPLANPKAFFTEGQSHANLSTLAILNGVVTILYDGFRRSRDYIGTLLLSSSGAISLLAITANLACYIPTFSDPVLHKVNTVPNSLFVSQNSLIPCLSSGGM